MINKTKISNKFFVAIALSTLVVLLVSFLITFKIMSDIKTDTYKLIKNELVTLLDDNINSKMKMGITNAISVASNADIVMAVNKNDKDLAYEVLSDILNKYKKYTAFKSPKIHIHTADVKSFLRSWIKEKNGDDLSGFRYSIKEVKKTQKPLTAIEVGKVGLVLRSIVPIHDKSGYKGSLEYIQAFDNVVDTFDKKGKYLLVLPKKELLMSLTDEKIVAHNLALAQNNYNQAFFDGFKKQKLSQLLGSEYLLDENYYYTIKPVIGFSDDVIGYYVMGKDIKEAQKGVSQAQEVVYLFVGLMLFLVLVIVIAVNIYLNRLVIRNLNKLSNGLSSFFKYLNKKSTKVDKIFIGTSDEMGQMAKEINTNIATVKTLIDYNNKQDWIKEGLNGLNNKLSGNNDMVSVCNNSINFLCEYLNAGIGALYIYDKNEELLYIKGTYAFLQKKDLFNIFKLGEGTIGQVALQKTPIQLENIIRTHMIISTGTTSEPPLNTYTFPLIYQEELYGVIEIGSTSLFNNIQREFFQFANDVIATKIFSAIQNKKVKDLLLESQETNIELKEQQTQLEEANSQMQEQQAQLEEANSQMEEQQVQLKESEKELKIQNSKLEKSKEQLEDSNKYKSEFLANMSHELRTPLNSVILLSSMLSQNKKQNLNEDDIKKAQIINSSGEDLLRLINDVLDLSKVEAGRMELVVDNFHSSKFIQKIRDMFEPSIHNNGLEFIVEDSYNEIIKTDENKLSQVLKNFLSNSLKFTHKGSIKLVVEPKDSNKIKISVKDTGIGIAKDKQELVFKAFSQADGSTSRQYGGTGLGLSITKEFVNLMDGAISLESQEGIGSTFSIVIPNLTKNKEVEESKQESLNNSENKQIENRSSKIIIDDSTKIKPTDKPFLIIEDNEVFALTLKAVINEKDDYALIAPTGQEGLELANRYKNIQGILLDLGLPDIDGIDVLKELKTNISTRKIPVYIISGSNKQNDTNLMGAVGFKQKPLSNNDLKKVFDDFNKVNSKKSKELIVNDINFDGKKIMVVDDDMRNTFVLVEILEEKGAEVITASNGQEALEILNNNLNTNIILMDIMMPVMDGYEAIKNIKMNENTKNIPIIAVTAKAMIKDKEKCLQVGANDCLTKPLNLETFVSVVKAWIK